MTAVSQPAVAATRAPRRNRRNPGKWVVHVILFCLAVVWLVPSVGLLITSFRPREAIATSGWWTAFSPAQFTVENYVEVLTAQGMGESFINSFKITIPGTLLPITLAAIAAYALAWMPIRGKDWILAALLALLVIPIQITLVPVLRLFNQFGLTGTYLGIWIAHTAYGLPFCIYLLRNFFISLPKELMESAKIDGASELTIFWRIVIPLSVPVLASLAIFQFMWVWNDLLVALVFMSDPVNQPMTVRIQAMLGTYATEWHIMSAASFISMAIPLVVFFALQRYFVAGLTAGSVKQ